MFWEILVFKYHPLPKGTWPLGQAVQSRAGAHKMQMRPELPDELQRDKVLKEPCQETQEPLEQAPSDPVRDSQAQ